MQVDEKLIYFSKIARQEAEQQRAEILADMEDELSKAMEEFTREVEKQARQRLRNEQNKIERTKNKEIIQAAAEAKKSLIALRSRYIDQIFENAVQSTREFTQTEQYKEKLLNEITALAGRYSHIKIYLMERDLSPLTRAALVAPAALLAPAAPGTEYIGVQEDFIGGFKLFIPEKNAVEDHTYAARLKNARAEFNQLKMKETV
ncbi:MAG: V-type ATP synthase subunit E [Clostridiales bacterium]|jgi:vacuolar-type H+-ATPase subunit E/Vma4|nr:V-type ATP synthase subunit E [Clostridiales bacterium]